MTLSKSLAASLALALFGASGVVQAEPTLYPQGSNLSLLGNLTNDTNSSLLADEESPNTVWVLPPATGKAYVHGLHTKSASMGFCAELSDLQKYSREQQAEINNLAKRRNSKAAEAERLQKVADALEFEAEKFAADKQLTALVSMDERLAGFEERLSELYEQANNCSTACDAINEEIATVTASKKTMMRDRNDIARKNAEDVRIYTKKQRAAAAAKKNVKSVMQVYTDLIAEIYAIKDTYLKRYSSFGAMEGAYSSLVYETNWNENIEALRKANPGIAFNKIATKNVKVMVENAGVPGFVGAGAVLAINVAGGKPQDNAFPFIAYPENLNTNVILSLLGACPMEHPKMFDVVENSAQRMKFGVIVSYEYDSIFTAKATVSYNMYKMYQKIVSSGSSGGFFSSRSWTNVEERTFFRDSMDIVWDDRENTISQEQKDAREGEMRQAVLGRLASLALANTPERADILAAAGAPVRGALVLSNELIRACPGNIYCVAGASFARVLDAIFGSSKTTASYTNITDTKLTESYSGKSKISKPLITSYL